MRSVVQDSVVGHYRASAAAQRLTAVRVHIEAGKVAAGNIDTNAVPFLEYIGRRERLYSYLVDLARLHQFLLLGRITVARANDTVGNVQVVPRRVIF